MLNKQGASDFRRLTVYDAGFKATSITFLSTIFLHAVRHMSDID